MRKYKQVKEKKITFSMPEWEEVERRAAALSMKTGTYIRKIAVDGNIIYYDVKNVTPVMNALRIIGGNINQIARKTNETNSIYTGDIENFRKEYTSLCHVLNQFLLGELPTIRHSKERSPMSRNVLTNTAIEMTEENKSELIKAIKIGYYKEFLKQGLITAEELDELIKMQDKTNAA